MLTVKKVDRILQLEEMLKASRRLTAKWRKSSRKFEAIFVEAMGEKKAAEREVEQQKTVSEGLRANLLIERAEVKALKENLETAEADVDKCRLLETAIEQHRALLREASADMVKKEGQLRVLRLRVEGHEATLIKLQGENRGLREARTELFIEIHVAKGERNHLRNQLNSSQPSTHNDLERARTRSARIPRDDSDAGEPNA